MGRWWGDLWLGLPASGWLARWPSLGFLGGLGGLGLHSACLLGVAGGLVGLDACGLGGLGPQNAINI